MSFKTKMIALLPFLFSNTPKSDKLEIPSDTGYKAPSMRKVRKKRAPDKTAIKRKTKKRMYNASRKLSRMDAKK